MTSPCAPALLLQAGPPGLRAGVLVLQAVEALRLAITALLIGSAAERAVHCRVPSGAQRLERPHGLVVQAMAAQVSACAAVRRRCSCRQRGKTAVGGRRGCLLTMPNTLMKVRMVWSEGGNNAHCPKSRYQALTACTQTLATQAQCGFSAPCLWCSQQGMAAVTCREPARQWERAGVLWKELASCPEPRAARGE